MLLPLIWYLTFPSPGGKIKLSPEGTVQRVGVINMLTNKDYLVAIQNPGRNTWDVVEVTKEVYDSVVASLGSSFLEDTLEYMPDLGTVVVNKTKEQVQKYVQDLVNTGEDIQIVYAEF